MLNYSNAVVTVKENVVVDESIFSAPLYAKLMLRKGMKFDEVLASHKENIKVDKETALEKFLENFFISDKGEHIRCEAFSKSQVTGAVVSHENSLWCNLSIDSKILFNDKTKMFFSELIPYEFNIEDAEELEF